MKIKELINSKISSGKKQINLERNTINGWGHDSNLNNTILEYRDISDLKNKISFDENSEKTRIHNSLKEFVTSEDRLDLLLDNMNKDMKKYDELIKDLIFTYNFIIVPELGLDDTTKDRLRIDIEQLLDDSLIEKSPDYYSTDISSNINYDLNQSKINDIEYINDSEGFSEVTDKNVWAMFTDFDTQTNKLADVYNANYKNRYNKHRDPVYI